MSTKIDIPLKDVYTYHEIEPCQLNYRYSSLIEVVQRWKNRLPSELNIAVSKREKQWQEGGVILYGFPFDSETSVVKERDDYGFYARDLQSSE